MYFTFKKILELFIFIILIIIFFQNSRAEHKISQELVVNGDFSQGNIGFTTDYKYSTINLKGEGRYTIDTNPNSIYRPFAPCHDNRMSKGKFMIVNGDTLLPLSKVWSQTVSGIRHKSGYEFSFWATTLVNYRSAYFQVRINGEVLNPQTVYLDTITCNWKHFVFKWESNNNDEAVINIIDLNNLAAGNDYGLDDISFQLKCTLEAEAGQNVTTCKGQPVKIGTPAINGLAPYKYNWSPWWGLDSSQVQSPVVKIDNTTTYYLMITDSNSCTATDSVTVFINPLPPSDITPDKHGILCANDSLMLTGPDGNYTYLWSTGDSTRSIFVHETGSFKLTVKNEYGCTASSSFQSVFSKMPDATITTNKETVFCPCDSIELSAPWGSDYIYKWSTGDTTRNIIVNNAGRYYLTVENSNGCKSFSDTSVIALNVKTNIGAASISAKVGDTVNIPIYISSEYNQKRCKVNNYNAKISFNKTLMLPTDNTPSGVTLGDKQIIEFSGATLDSVLTILEFIAVLGDDTCTSINFESFNWNCNDIEVNTSGGEMCLQDICRENGPRLFVDNGILFLSQNYPNPSNTSTTIHFNIIEDAVSQLIVVNPLGETVDIIKDDIQKPGSYNITYSTIKIESGTYFILLNTPSGILSRRMDVIK
jgi:hypothetical protein